MKVVGVFVHRINGESGRCLDATLDLFVNLAAPEVQIWVTGRIKQILHDREEEFNAG